MAEPTKGATAVKKKRIRGPELLWTIRLEKYWLDARSQVREIRAGLRSPDAPTRRMSLLFFLSLFGLVFSTGWALYRAREWLGPKPGELSQTEIENRNLGEFFRKQADGARRRASMLNLGTFTVELKTLPDQKPIPGVFNLAEVELVLDFDARETKDWVEGHLVQARNQLTNVFTSIDRAELMTRDGKKRLKKQMVEKLNLWLPKGKVEELFFSKLLLS